MDVRVAIALSVFAWGSIAFAPPATSSAAALPEAHGPVVLELFTSQGCSSCPPAERVLSRLGLDEKTRANVVPLAFHVDYWNAGGWTDPFSAREWTARQEAYSRALGVDGPYTPQLIVGGRSQLTGGNETRARAEIGTALEQPPGARISLTARRDGAGLTVDVTAEISETLPARKLKALVALFENGLATAVERGENRGHTLQNDFIVRRLETAFSLEGKAGVRKQQVLTVKLDPAWKLENVGVAAFLQDPGSMRIYGAVSLQSVR